VFPGSRMQAGGRTLQLKPSLNLLLRARRTRMSGSTKVSLPAIAGTSLLPFFLPEGFVI
jgi:hypothetical protein